MKYFLYTWHVFILLEIFLNFIYDIYLNFQELQKYTKYRMRKWTINSSEIEHTIIGFSV